MVDNIVEAGAMHQLDTIPDNSLPFVVEAWKQTVDLQKHFNDLCLRIRTLGVTIVTTIFGAVGLAEATNVQIQPRWLFAAGLLGWVACWLLDRMWYHQLLRGAVRHGHYIEKLAEKLVPGIGLATKLSEVDSSGWLKLSAHRRIDLFYALIGIILAGFLIAVP